MAIPINVVPSGFPMLWRREYEVDEADVVGLRTEVDKRGGKEFGLTLSTAPVPPELKRKSWVTAIPIDAKANEVLSQAKKVLSVV